MSYKIIQEEAEQSNNSTCPFKIGTFFSALLKAAGVGKEDIDKVVGKLQNEMTNKPFRVAVIGQSGVGKSSTLNHVFGLNLPVSDIDEGTTEVIEKIFPIHDGFNLSVYDMPGLLHSRIKDKEYFEMYKEILPKCDVIVYIIKANTRNIGDDCKILKEVVLPICNDSDKKNSLIITINKVDIIGESIDPNDNELQWDIEKNEPSPKLKDLIKQKRLDIFEKMVDEELVLLNSDKVLSPEQFVFYSATYDYGLSNFLKAIANAGSTNFMWVFERLSELKGTIK